MSHLMVRSMKAVLFIAHHKLTNVVWLVDRNRLQGFGRTEEVMGLDPLDKKMEAFGFDVIQINGHDFTEFDAAKEKAAKNSRPTAIICNTVKGNNWITYENKVDSHYLPMKEEYELVMAEVERFYNEQTNNL